MNRPECGLPVAEGRDLERRPRIDDILARFTERGFLTGLTAAGYSITRGGLQRRLRRGRLATGGS